MEPVRRFLTGCISLSPRGKQNEAESEGYRSWYKEEEILPMQPTARVQSIPAPSSDPAVHLTVIMDTSAAMQGSPLKAVSKGLQLLLRFIQPQDVLTIWLFDSAIAPPIHCEAQYFTEQLCRQTFEQGLASARADGVLLYDTVVKAVEGLESQGPRPLVIKPLLVFTDMHESYGEAEAFEAKNALLWCEIPHVSPILISARDPDVFDEVRQTKTREVFVETTEDNDVCKAFQVAGEHLQAILKQANAS